jgi:hypothetical protein
MLNLLFNQNFDSLVIIVSAITTVGLALSLYNGYTEHYYINRVHQAEAARVQEGLPNQITLTPEDFAKNPELAEILEVTDVNKDLNLNLETIEHIEHLENQDAAIEVMDIIEVIEDFLSAVFMYAFDFYSYYYIYINEIFNYVFN